MPAYVNYRGEQIGLITHPAPVKTKPDPQAFHKGWRVEGISPEAVAEARRLAKGNANWDEDAWAMNAKRVPVRAKPYGIRSAADACAQLAKKSGWLRVEVAEVKKGEAPKRDALMSGRAE